MSKNKFLASINILSLFMLFITCYNITYLSAFQGYLFEKTSYIVAVVLPIVAFLFCFASILFSIANSKNILLDINIVFVNLLSIILMLVYCKEDYKMYKLISDILFCFVYIVLYFVGKKFFKDKNSNAKFDLFSIVFCGLLFWHPFNTFSIFVIVVGYFIYSFASPKKYVFYIEMVIIFILSFILFMIDIYDFGSYLMLLFNVISMLYCVLYFALSLSSKGKALVAKFFDKDSNKNINDNDNANIDNKNI